MDFNYVSSIQYCSSYVSELSNLLLYSHISPAALAIVLAFFVLAKQFSNRQALTLGLIAFTFSLWSILDLVIWLNYDHSSLLMSAWSIIESVALSIFALTAYFVFIYLYKRDLNIVAKLALSMPVFLSMVISPSELNLVAYDAQECIAVENDLYTLFLNFSKILYAALIGGLIVWNLVVTTAKTSRKEIAVLGIGAVSFIYSFLLSGYAAESSGDYTLEIYGLFGMVIFIGSLSYLIVKYSAFNIKLIAAQALVTALALIVAAQSFFYSSTSELVIKILTTLLVVVFGFFLVRSVKREIKEKERNESLAKDLAKANKRLRELDKLKSEFVSIASHQLRSPLTAIRGYASMLIDGDFGAFPAKAQDALTKIDESSHFMAMSIDDFLNVSRIESGSMKYEKSVFSLKEEASKVVDELRPTAIKKGLVLMFRSTAETDMHVNADIGKIHQILQNVIDNAMKYTPKGQITVVAHDDPKLKKAYISVVDTGIGMSPETAGTIFDKFVRAKNANSVNVFGTGLGLFIAKQMVEAMGGAIIPSSEGEGKGSTFKIELPLVN